MSSEDGAVQRRTVLRGALAAGAAIPVGGALAGCATGGGGSGSSSTSSAAASSTATGADAKTNPFGVKGSVEAVIFNGGYNYDYVQYAAKIMQKNISGTTVSVKPSTQIGTELQPRFVSGNPPDMIDDSGKNAIGLNTLAAQLEDLTEVFNSQNLEGTKISDTLYPGVSEPGTINGKLVAINYVLTLYALWYSKSLFDANGWTPPKTFDDLMSLGAKAKAKGKYLFITGKESATYYQTFAIGAAVKEGGDEVRLALDNLESNAWSQKPIQDVFSAMEKLIKAGYFFPGGTGTQFTAAQAHWSDNQQALLYPSGSWIENEMKDQTKSGFKMTGCPEPTVSSSPKMPYAALHSAAGEPYIVPSKGKNAAGGKELLRTMLSKDAATNFTKTKLAPTIVKGNIPSDGFGSSALVSQQEMLKNAGTNVFGWHFVDVYGLNEDQLVPWQGFLSGQLDVAGLTKRLQAISDAVPKNQRVTFK